MRDNNKTFSKMAAGVEEALQNMRDCEATVAEEDRRLGAARRRLADAEVEFNKRKVALFQEFPELAPVSPAAVAQPATPTPQPSEPKPVMSPQGPVVFREHDDIPEGLG